MRMVVRDFTQMTIGPEVVEETDTRVLLKDLLNPAEMPFDNTIRRMYVIVKNMFADAFTLLETTDKGLARDIIARDKDVNRLHWLVARQTNIIMRNSSLARRMGVDPMSVVNAFIISRILERIGDHAVKYAENAGKIRSADLESGLMDAIRKAASLGQAIFDRSIVSFFNSDIKDSHKNIEQVEKIEGLCDRINTFSLNTDAESAISIRYISESIRRAGEYSGDISENVINTLVERES